MSNVATCPTCGSKAKIKATGESVTYETLQDDQLIEKVEQLKKAMQNYKEKAEQIEKLLKEKR